MEIDGEMTKVGRASYIAQNGPAHAVQVAMDKLFEQYEAKRAREYEPLFDLAARMLEPDMAARITAVECTDQLLPMYNAAPEALSRLMAAFRLRPIGKYSAFMENMAQDAGGVEHALRWGALEWIGAILFYLINNFEREGGASVCVVYLINARRYSELSTFVSTVGPGLHASDAVALVETLLDNFPPRSEENDILADILDNLHLPESTALPVLRVLVQHRRLELGVSMVEAFQNDATSESHVRESETLYAMLRATLGQFSPGEQLEALSSLRYDESAMARFLYRGKPDLLLKAAPTLFKRMLNEPDTLYEVVRVFPSLQPPFVHFLFQQKKSELWEAAFGNIPSLRHEAFQLFCTNADLLNCNQDVDAFVALVPNFDDYQLVDAKQGGPRRAYFVNVGLSDHASAKAVLTDNNSEFGPHDHKCLPAPPFPAAPPPDEEEMVPEGGFEGLVVRICVVIWYLTHSRLQHFPTCLAEGTNNNPHTIRGFRSAVCNMMTKNKLGSGWSKLFGKRPSDFSYGGNKLAHFLSFFFENYDAKETLTFTPWAVASLVLGHTDWTQNKKEELGNEVTLAALIKEAKEVVLKQRAS
jgi:hypothetical protein